MVFSVVLSLQIIPVTYEVTEALQKTETYTEKEPYQVTEIKTEMLINRTSIVSAAHYQYQRVYFNISGKEKYVVSGNVTETSGYDINFFVFDQNGYNDWREGGSSVAYVSAKKIESYSYTFVINQSGYYYFILDNTYTFLNNKVPEITTSYSYQVNTTKYREVQKTRAVIEYVNVTKTKHVSLYQILTGTR